MNVIDTTEGCRFCLMCRHVCPVTRVTFNEATSPHGWALEIASVRRGLLEWNAETTNLLYQCADCGLCNAFCVTDQPLPQAIVAARAEVVAGGHAPASVAAVDAALRQWGNPYGPHPLAPSPIAKGEGEQISAASIAKGEGEQIGAAAIAKGEGEQISAASIAKGEGEQISAASIAKGEGNESLPSPAAAGEGPGVRAATLLFVGTTAWNGERASLDAARALLDHVGMGHGLLAAGRDSGYLAYTLGLHATARDLALATVTEVQQSGCRMLVALSPEQAFTLKAVYPLLGVALPDEVEVIELTVLLARLLAEDRLTLRAAPIDLMYHDPCQAPRIDGRWRAPRRLLAAATSLPLREAFWHEQRAAPCGASGGLPWTQPRLANALALAALKDAASRGARLLVTDAPGCLAHLRAVADGQGMLVRGLYEVLAEGLEA